MLYEIAKCAKSDCQIPTESDEMEEGILYWDFIRVLSSVVRPNYDEMEFQAEDFDRISVGHYTDSDDFSEPEEQKEEPPPQ